MKQYLDLLRHVRDHGTRKKSRAVLQSTGLAPDTLSVFGYQVRFDLQNGFPAVTTKKLMFDAVVHELLWFLSGRSDIEYLHRHGVHIWDQWANSEGDCGPIYGVQWRSWFGNSLRPQHTEGIDQIAEVIESIRKNPDSRRLVVSAWNVDDIPDMRLPPCHVLFQFYVLEGLLSCHVYMRSTDAFLGLPFNIASYALLTHMVAHVTQLKPGDLVFSFGDLHLYENHREAVQVQLDREPFELPGLLLDPSISKIDDFEREHISLIDYQSHPGLKAEVAV